MSDSASPAYFGIRNTLLKQSDQLAGVPEPDRAAVLGNALEAVPVAAGFLRPYSALFADGDSSASRLAFSCLSAAATFPQAGRDEVAELGTLTAILFGLDDIADNIAGSWTPDDIVRIFGLLSAVLRGQETEPGEGPVGEAVSAWRDWWTRIGAHPGMAAYAPVLAEQLDLAGAAMARERVWAEGREPWPDYATYVDNGTQTILYRTWWVAGLGVRGPEPAHDRHWRAVLPATHLGATCMRLANDIRTFERERGEGKPNSVLILEHAGTDTEAAVARVAAHIAELNARFLDALAELPPELAGIAEGQRRSVSFNGAWYLARDTHAYTVRELTGDAGAHGG
ncbi:terpene synthase family protein [Nonomuraea sp. NPDC001023]|uniref:terpene synthase family protein n=1 Tax=unclassified Nonomuraea TaxID=2593643 RepID=UPI00333471E9